MRELPLKVGFMAMFQLASSFQMKKEYEILPNISYTGKAVNKV